MTEYNTGEDPEHSPRRWPGWLALLVLIVLAWVLYELTEQPGIGVAAICTKFGWEDFRTAWWLGRTDPHRRRGRACFCLYAASGLWKMAITASLMIFAYVLLHAVGVLGGPQAAPHVVGAVLTAFAGILLAALAACTAVILAFSSEVRLWLHHGIHRARRKQLWPPPHWPPHSGNLAGMLLGTSLFAVLVPVLFVGLIAWAVPVLGLGPAALLIWFFVMYSLLALSLWALVKKGLAPRVFAASPARCWKAIAEKPAELFVGDEVAASRSGNC